MYELSFNFLFFLSGRVLNSFLHFYKKFSEFYLQSNKSKILLSIFGSEILEAAISINWF